MNEPTTIKLHDGRELMFHQNLNHDECHLQVGLESWQFIGTISNDYEASFDVEPFVPKVGYRITYANRRFLVELVSPEGYMVLDESFQESTGRDREAYIEEHGNDGRFQVSFKSYFQSLMNANGLFMHNPVPKPETITRDITMVERMILSKNIEDWQEAQKKVVNKYVVLIKNKP